MRTDTNMNTTAVADSVTERPTPAPSVTWTRGLELTSSEPIRGALFGLEHLEDHARQLAAACQVTDQGLPGDPLLHRFVQNGLELARAHERIVEANRNQEPITPDAEWLLDNFHIIEDNLREVRHDLPRGYYKELPKLADGPLAGLPRVYLLGVELIAHTDSSLDETNVIHFVQAWQQAAPLTIGELWAVPIMLRLGLLENLRRLAGQMIHAWDQRQHGDRWAARLVGLRDAIASDPEVRQAHSTWTDPCLVRLLQALRDHGLDATSAIEWLEQSLERRGQPHTEVLRREHQRQAGNQVSVGNCVTSLRLLSNLDWSVFFEKTSLVEAALRRDPAGVYARQDFPTKDRYRRTVEQLARRSGLGEMEVAHRAVSLASQNLPRPGTPRTASEHPLPPWNHVGYYLVGRGRPELERQIRYRPTLGQRLLAGTLAHPEAIYFGSLLLATGLLLAGILAWVADGSGASPPWLLLAFFAALLPASDLAVGLVHYLLTWALPPRVLPKLDFKDGIPTDCPTFVVMPTMLTSPDSGAVLADRLEVHYLSNPDPQLRFALLTDFADSPTEHRPEDEPYLQNALEHIHALNERYAGGGPDRFFLFHRRRLWNPVQGCWMGWERKRGKLSEFNRLLRGASDTTYATISGDLSQLPRIRFVITLDADTQLPRETARRLVATLAHPLNQPHFDAAQGRVVEGYGILQPRVSLNLVAATRSLFSRLLASSAGIDPYTTAVSDVYQDLFGRGTFTGKGIYDVDAFESAVGHTFPENHILSHDLIEGNYARCGLVTDIELLDDFPSRYHAYARREHRWVRGDWQILPWLFSHVPGPDPTDAPPPHENGVEAAAPPTDSRPNTLPALERWKIFDNLRRSLVPPALVIMLVLGWTVLPGTPAFWTLLAIVVLGLPLFLLLVSSAVSLIRSGHWHLQLRELRVSVPATAGQAVLAVSFLAEQARLMIDAIAGTLVRLTVTRRHLLEWETAASTESRLGTGFAHFCLMMWPGPVLAVAVGILVGFVRPDALPFACPVLLAWFVSPAIAYAVSRPRVVVEPPLTAEERRELRRLARKTWLFFETFVTARDHWLPPDNYQEDPKGAVAPRTSPTNIGLYLLSSLAATDFGYLSLGALADRLGHTFDTLGRLERFRGHFFNWYDTRTLDLLEPAYVSTVDSGNMLGCLLALRQGLLARTQAPLFDADAVRAGLLDTLLLATESLRVLERPRAATAPVLQRLEASLGETERLLSESPSADLFALDRWLQELTRRTEDMARQVKELATDLGEEPEVLARWIGHLARQVDEQGRYLHDVAPWLESCRSVVDSGSWMVGGEANSSSHHPPSTTHHPPLSLLATPFALADFAAWKEEALAELALRERDDLPVPQRVLLTALREGIGKSAAPSLLVQLRGLADRAKAFAAAMNFKFLYNEQRHLFSIGYNYSQGRLDNAHYDLLASEACLTSFLAIARGDVPRRHWFQLGRPLTRAGQGLALISWGGTMFEYLMPRLLLPSYDGTLVAESCRAAVDRQIEYARQCRVPWGISESAFNALDAALDYQYQSFGVPGLGLKRGLSRDLVIAPYATCLALMIRPHAALANLRALAAEKAEGPFGMYEAVDYTRDRLLERRRSAVVRSYMAHHQGMSFVALANTLLGTGDRSAAGRGEPLMVRRFHAEPMVRATDLMLQERVPRVAPVIEPHEDEAAPPPVIREGLLPMSRRMTTPDTPLPRTQLLSSGRYTVFLTNAGAGGSSCRDLDVTRWREDRTCDNWGQWCYVRDLRSGLLWSAGHQPVCRPADRYEVLYSTDKAEFIRRDGNIETHLEVTVSPENAAEVRRVTLTNHGNRPHELELTSYAEVVLLPHRADLSHPAFGKLFLETEFISSRSALLCRRRPRSADQNPVWCVHVLAVDGPAVGGVQYETDRARFLGRGRTVARPAALEPGAVLSGTTGPVLDPIVSLRRRVRVAPGASVSVAFTTAVAASREEALALADHYHDFHGVTRAFELAWAHTQVQLRHLHLSGEDAHLYQRLAAHILYAGPTLRAPAAVLAANRLGQPGLWRFGISGDLPILLVRVSGTVPANEELSLLRQVLLAHAYWRLLGLAVDLVLLNEHPSGYLEEMQQQLNNLVRASDSHGLIDRPGGIFIRKADHLSDDERNLLLSAARVVLTGNRGSLTAQVDQVERRPPLPGLLTLTTAPPRLQVPLAGGASPETPEAVPNLPVPALAFPNGFGGFVNGGREYVLHLSSAGQADLHLPPAPWVNVIANPRFGFLVSESGGGCTWASNSQQNRLTPWNNDPVTDPPGEVIYLRDDTTGEVWTPTPLPLGIGAANLVRHGQGYTVFEQARPGLRQELVLFVPPDDTVKLLRLRVRNTGSRPRRLSAALYAEWVLGTWRDQAPMSVITEVDDATGALLARNSFNTDYAASVAFAAVNLPHTLTGDRTEFLGRNGSLLHPAALERIELSGRVGAALDPCAALLAPFELQPGEEKEALFLLGEGSGRDPLAEVRRLVTEYCDPGRAQAALDSACGMWDRLLDTVRVETPEPGMDVLLNRWLLYQVLSCRVWGRTAFYQSGGAYGFRDQLQDVMSLVHARPDQARAQVLRAASRQFLEGDVQHWWHPPVGRGVRTRFSDDFLWLPFVTHHYVEATGDQGILDESVHFLRGPLLRPEQEEEYGLPEVTEEAASLYEHCARAIDNGLHYGPHGLPLMGTGDWNDGMNRVGSGGRGESVWDGWFQLTILPRFAEWARRRGDTERAARYTAEADRLRQAMEKEAWDGAWYRRAYFDDGTPLGSAENTECQIDSLPQTWAVISGAADPERARQAMAAVEQRLVRWAEGLVLLFTPPFDQGTLQPGYIKGYVPGIRENGGQYTHAATWVVQATAQLGHGTRAAELFRLLSPVSHTSSPEAVSRYKVEPYVVCADVYGEPPHVGRGGWTWYTGSAAWLYRVGLESILGFHRHGDRLRIEPCIPSAWPGFTLHYRHGTALYHIHVENPEHVERGVSTITLDGNTLPDGMVPLADDGREHEVRVVLGPAEKPGEPATSA
jgi:cyclic beta-1,2-glucan synthetase